MNKDSISDNSVVVVVRFQSWFISIWVARLEGDEVPDVVRWVAPPIYQYHRMSWSKEEKLDVMWCFAAVITDLKASIIPDPIRIGSHESTLSRSK